MARPLRIEFLGAVYHVTSRGKGRRSGYANTRVGSRLTSLQSDRLVTVQGSCAEWCSMCREQRRTPSATGEEPK